LQCSWVLLLWCVSFWQWFVVVIDAAVAPDATMDVFARMVVDVISVALICGIVALYILGFHSLMPLHYVKVIQKVGQVC
jgi:hypothetical protein